MTIRSVLFLLLLFSGAPDAFAQAPVEYRLSFPEPEHRWMQVDITFRELPAGPLQLRMSRSSPGRYALHEFAKNVFDVRITNGRGKPLQAARPNLHGWDVAGHDGTVKVTYRVFGDRVDGTYLAVDSTHAHMNMPATLMWARGLDARPATVTLQPPASASNWRAATQLLPTKDPHTFTAPNLQYLLDSPTEYSAHTLRTFTVRDGARVPEFRIALHHAGSDADADAYAKDVEAIVREMKHVFGEYPAFEGNTYTFIADYLPWASGDGMEHRNSTILTGRASIAADRANLLGTVSHEFFHAWNVERIRPRTLEPFNFEDANTSGELWLAEGFTTYYGPLVNQRAGLSSLPEFTGMLANFVNAVTLSPGRLIRSAEEMSRFAPFVDAAAAIDRTAFSNTFISYYTWGAAIGLGLDLTLRDRSEGKVTLDTFFRLLWTRFGKPGGKVPGVVDRPYTLADAKAALADVSNDAAFADEFFARYIQGHDVVDYRRLLARAGLLLRPKSPGAAYAGALQLRDVDGRLRVDGSVPFGSPAYAAGLERDDEIEALAGTPVQDAAGWNAALRAQRPGAAVPLVFLRRGGRVTASLKLAEDPRQEIVPVETAGSVLTAAQKQFRDQWLSSREPTPVTPGAPFVAGRIDELPEPVESLRRRGWHPRGREAIQVASGAARR